LDAFHDLQTQSPARCPEKNMPFTTPPSNKDTTASRINVSTEPTQVYVQRIQRKNEKPSLKTALTGIKILGTGASTGSKCVPNEDLAELGYDSDWILQRTGIQSRFHVAEGEATSDLAIRAVDQCLENAGVDGKDVDLIILATVSPDHVHLRRLVLFRPILAVMLLRWTSTRPALDSSTGSSLPVNLFEMDVPETHS
jgi:hypothetical protein